MSSYLVFIVLLHIPNLCYLVYISYVYLLIFNGRMNPEGLAEGKPH